MEDLFLTSFPQHYGQASPSLDGLLHETNASNFEIEDCQEHMNVHLQAGLGMARIENPDLLNLRIFNYEGYINRFSHQFQHGKKRCDFLLASDNDRYFVLGELKDRNPFDDVEQGARKQLLGSLLTILNVPEISAFIDTKPIRNCCYFNKQASAPQVINATDAFNRINELQHDGFEMKDHKFMQHGFGYYEFYGAQTMKLTA